jgi:transcriptional regulator with XRE-family HTH domain
MGMKDFKGFIFYNNLSQKEVMKYLQVSKGYMSLVISGKKNLSEENFRKLIENPYGWDTSMLTSNQPEVPAEEKPTTENSLLEYLQRKIEKLEREKEELLQENAVLKYENMMLTPRKGDAEDAASSLSADAI